MSRIPSPDDSALREQLVAYLDGELAGEDESAIEARIARDDACRSEMQGLERAWNALDVLPRATVDDSFTRTTIEMVALEAQKEVTEKTALLPVKRRTQWTKWALATVAATLAGVLLSRAIAPDPNRALYAELPLISELDAYNQAIDLDFLRGLPAALPDHFGAQLDPAIEARSQTLATLTSATIRARSAHVAALPADAQYDLAGKDSRYRGMSPQRRETLQTLHQSIADDNDAQALWHAMLVYSNWAAQLPAAEQANLRSQSSAERLQSITQIDRRIGQRQAFELSSANAQALRDQFQQLLNDEALTRRYEQLVEKLPNAPKLFMRELEKRNKGRARVAVLMFARGAEMEDVAEFREYYQAVETSLVSVLDDATRRRFQSEPPERRGWMLLGWLKDAFSEVSREDLQKYFASPQVTDAQRQQLLALPKDEMERRLKDMYAAAYFGDDRPDGWLPKQLLDDAARRGRDRRSFGPPGERGGFGPPDDRGGPGGRDDRRGPPPMDDDRRGGPPFEGGPFGPPPPGGERPPGPPPAEGI